MSASTDDLAYIEYLQTALYAHTGGHVELDDASETAHAASVVSSLHASLKVLGRVPVEPGFVGAHVAATHLLFDDDHLPESFIDNPARRMCLLLVIKHNSAQPWTLKGTHWTFGLALDHVAAYAETHAQRACIYHRLVDELWDGLRMCPLGKLERLVNCLTGFHPDIRIALKPGELLQNRMAAIAGRDATHDEKLAEARSVLTDMCVAQTDWPAWLSAL